MLDNRAIATPGLNQLRLLQLVSPNLPTGAFTYSQGLEWAVQCGWITDQQQTQEWLLSVLQASIESLELPVLIRLYQALHNKQDIDTEAFSYWCGRLYASRETHELRQEEKQRARAMLTLLQQLTDSQHWPELQTLQQELKQCQLASFALAASYWEINLQDTLTGYCWSWLENAVAAAIKLVPLGQTQGQQLLLNMGHEVAMTIQNSLQIEEQRIGASTPAMAIASSLHETQYSRLFRS